jgi:hypothetical protein
MFLEVIYFCSVQNTEYQLGTLSRFADTGELDAVHETKWPWTKVAPGRDHHDTEENAGQRGDPTPVMVIYQDCAAR